MIAVVATQSIAILRGLIAHELPQPYKLEFNFVALSMWLWGGMFCSWIISLIFYRYTFFTFSPGDLSPPCWINMGAMAISTLAGARLVENTPDAPFPPSLRALPSSTGSRRPGGSRCWLCLAYGVTSSGGSRLDTDAPRPEPAQGAQQEVGRRPAPLVR